jgi:hypothetical protein
MHFERCNINAWGWYLLTKFSGGRHIRSSLLTKQFRTPATRPLPEAAISGRGWRLGPEAAKFREQLAILQDTDAVGEALRFDGGIVEVAIPRTEDAGLSCCGRGNHEIVRRIASRDGRGIQRRHDQRTALYGLAVCVDARVVESVQGTHSGILKDPGQLRQEGSRRDEEVGRLRDEGTELPGQR